ncbi:hypothetical protein ACIRFH_13635 [Streptomyces sp. NPDC093586]|uniref:hypothetical protein n=1 Tax=Streptomyces sp. NPDC093586 TaxID=3366042 RepID=UPI00382941FA
MYFDDDEPVFKRSRWGTSRYTYNPRNPVGFALIVVSLLLAGAMMLLMHLHAGPFASPEESTPTPVSTPDLSRYLLPHDDGLPSGTPSDTGHDGP